jgi:hypothetical protein
VRVFRIGDERFRLECCLPAALSHRISRDRQPSDPPAGECSGCNWDRRSLDEHPVIRLFHPFCHKGGGWAGWCVSVSAGVASPADSQHGEHEDTRSSTERPGGGKPIGSSASPAFSGRFARRARLYQRPRPLTGFVRRDRWYPIDFARGRMMLPLATPRAYQSALRATGCTHLTNLLIFLACQFSLAIRTRLFPKR